MDTLGGDGVIWVHRGKLPAILKVDGRSDFIMYNTESALTTGPILYMTTLIKNGRKATGWRAARREAF